VFYTQTTLQTPPLQKWAPVPWRLKLILWYQLSQKGKQAAYSHFESDLFTSTEETLTVLMISARSEYIL
jgi:hypothetical protein